MQPLRMPVQVYSGIEPPTALIHEMTKKQGNPQQRTDHHLSATFASNPEPLSSPGSGQASRPDVTITYPQHPGLSTGAIPDEPPPSYEDAMAEDLAPVDGPRREYEQPESRPVVGNEKRGGLFERNERLFS